MGCFSFICQKCSKPINSTSFEGEGVVLFLLQDGELVEAMVGDYDSYGRVFKKNESDSQEWTMEWNDVCNLMFDPSPANGIAAVHTECWDGKIPTERSEDDPNQGWGELEKTNSPIQDITGSGLKIKTWQIALQGGEE